MTVEQALLIAEKSLKKAEKNYEHSSKRPGIKETELENLKTKIEYAKYVYEMLSAHKKYEDYVKAEASEQRAYGTWRDDYELEG